MSVSPTKIFLAAIVLGGFAAPVVAQTSVVTGRAASFLPDEASVPAETTGFSGLAAAPEQIAPPVAVDPVVPAPVVSTPVSAPVPVVVSATTSVASPQEPPTASTESIGVAASDKLGAALWKGAPRATVERLMTMATLTRSPVLNDLMRRVLATAASPPEKDADGDAETAQSLTALRVEKLIAFGDADTAWSLATHAEPKLIDDITFHYAAETELATHADAVCPALTATAKTRVSVDWRKALLICQLREKDADPETVRGMLAALNADANRDAIFMEIIAKNIQADGKTLPHQLTPLTPILLALLRQANVGLSGEVYGHPDFALVPALLRAPARLDVAQLGLAERAAERGIISGGELEAVYHTVVFTPLELSAPLVATESGSRLRALLYQAALGDKEPADRVAYAVKFAQSASPALMNGAGGAVAAAILGDLKPEAALGHTVAVAQIYMLAGRDEWARGWVRIARQDEQAAHEFHNVWPQFALAGLSAEGDDAAALTRWLEVSLKAADPQADMRAVRETTARTLLLMGAAGWHIPDSAWTQVLAAPSNEKKVALSPVLFDRLQAAGNAGQRGESILLAVAIAGDDEISLPVAVAITRALHNVGLKNEAATLARQTIALLAKTNG